MPIVLSLSSLRPTPSAPDLLFPSASDLWFRALPRAFLCSFHYLCQTEMIIKTIMNRKTTHRETLPSQLVQNPSRRVFG